VKKRGEWSGKAETSDKQENEVGKPEGRKVGSKDLQEVEGWRPKSLSGRGLEQKPGDGNKGKPHLTKAENGEK